LQFLEFIESFLEGNEFGGAYRREVCRVAEQDKPSSLIAIGQFNVSPCGSDLDFGESLAN
jgi:hypothetical protein